MAGKSSCPSGQGKPQGIYLAGIPIWENACAKEIRKGQNQGFHETQTGTRQGGRTTRNAADDATKDVRYTSGYTNPEAADIAGAIAGPVATVAGAIIDPFSGLSSGLGGVLGDLGLGTPTTPAAAPSPLLLLGGMVLIGGVLYYATEG